MLENKFQRDLIKDIKKALPGCIVLKNDANYLQGFPDLTILHGDRWAVLECKRSATERFQPNQEYYLNELAGMSYATVVHPDNKEEVIYELQQTLTSRRTTRVSKR